MSFDTGVTKREFIERALAVGLTIPAATALFDKSAKAAPKRGGSITVGMADGSTSDSWDPAVTNTRYMIVTHNAVTMARMHRLFGVTMIEKGVSRLVSVDLGGAEELLAAE